MSRRGFIPVTAAKNYSKLLSWCYFPSGWWAYGFVVPPQGKLHVRLHHPNEGWFRLLMVDRWGESRRQGMLQNLIPTGNPEVSYTNPMAAPNTVYVIVDDPGWMSSEKNPYTLEVTRNWDVSNTQTPDLPSVMGVWAQTNSNIPDIKFPLEPALTKAP
jgi:hypothetical protein